MKLSLVIPCYNEEKNIPLIVSRLEAILGSRQNVEVILVDNGSTDRSAGVMQSVLQKLNDKRFLHHSVPVNKGYGHGILSGLSVAQGDLLGWTHADMQTDPSDVLTALDLYQQTLVTSGCKKFIIKGKRSHRGYLEGFFTFGMQLIASAALKMWLDDINAQPKVFSRDFFEQHLRGIAPEDFSLDLFFLYQAKKNGYVCLMVPVQFAKRQYGEAKGGGSWKTRLKLVRRTFVYIFKLRQQIVF